MKIHDAMFGFCVGDALGVPFEFLPRDSFTVTDMVGYGTYGLPAGTWSDDSSMTFATLESLIEKKCIDPVDMMNRFLSWADDANYTARGEVFDMGITTRRALIEYQTSGSIKNCGQKGFRDNGNGSLMRILPLAFVSHTKKDVYDVSALTHAHEISVMACQYYLMIAEKLLQGMDKMDAVKSIEKECEGVFIRLPHIDSYSRETIKSSGYVVDTLEAALWCFLKTESYRDCVLTAVALGSDTDTVAAIAGGLAGIYYGIGGENGIPTEWIEKLARVEWIEKLCDSLS